MFSYIFFEKMEERLNHFKNRFFAFVNRKIDVNDEEIFAIEILPNDINML